MKPHVRAFRLEVLAAYDAGESAPSLHARYGVTLGTLRRWRQLRDETGDIEPRGHGGGHPPALDEAGRQLLTKLRLDFPDDSSQQLAERLTQAGFKVAGSTVSRYLKDAGFVRYALKSSAKKMLSEASKRPSARRYRRAVQPPDAPHRRAYPSDLTDAEWLVLEPLVPAPKSGGREAIHSRREVVNAILYVLRSGCQWRMLPHDFPPWETIYDYFRRWRDSGLWEQINHALREKLRQRAGREETPSAVIIDSQSVKTTEKGGLVDTTEPSV